MSTIGQDETIPSWLIHTDPLGLNGVGSSREGSLKDEDYYIPKPFPEHVFEPMGWRDTLSTLDRKSTRLNSSHSGESRMPSSA